MKLLKSAVGSMLIAFAALGPAQLQASDFGLKTNLLYDATTTMNLGGELQLNDKWSLDLSGNYNPWTHSGGKKWKHWMVQPEVRYWRVKPKARCIC